MYGKVKLSKRQIKEDKFTAFMLHAKHQLEENWQFYLIGVVVVILAVVATIYYTNNRETRKQDAADRYAAAVREYRTGNTQLATMGLNELVEEYSGDQSAEQALFLLGNINLETRNYAEAIRFYQMYVDKYRDNKLNRAAAFAGMAASQENQGAYPDAAKQFAAAYDSYPDGPMAGDYQMSAMRCYLAANDSAQARAHLDVIKDKFKGTDLEKKAVRLFTEKTES